MPGTVAAPQNGKKFVLALQEHGRNSLKGPVNFFFLDNQGRRKTHGVLMSFFAQQTFGHELFAKAPGSPRFRQEFYTDHQSLASDFFEMGTVHAL
jgi:hypothetical protein